MEFLYRPDGTILTKWSHSWALSTALLQSKSWKERKIKTCEVYYSWNIFFGILLEPNKARKTSIKWLTLFGLGKMNISQILFWYIYLSRLLKKVGVYSITNYFLFVRRDLNSIPGSFEMKCYCTTIIIWFYSYTKVGGY